MIFAICLALLAVLLTGISQVLLKIGSQKGSKKEQFLAVYLNIHTLAAYGLLLIVTVISVIALREIQLKVFYAIASLNFVVVLVLSWALLREIINKEKILAICLIITGIWVFNIGNFYIL
jgi:multidrug transporter EmrE-like cation transporter